MPNKLFLESYPLYKKYKIELPYYNYYIKKISKPAINMFCDECKSSQTFNMENEYWELQANSEYNASNIEISEIPMRACYVCSACNQYKYYFFIQFVETKKVEKKETIHYQGYLRKIGQTPEWKIDIDKSLERSLGKSASLYKKGLVCESQSYGIGSYAYFRRITEKNIDSLLTSISGIIDEDEKATYEEALAKVKKTRVTEEKIELVQDLLPKSLQPRGANPLKTLHSVLSDGIHNLSDDDCLEKADTIKTVLVFLVEEINTRSEKAKNFTDKMKRLLKKKKK